jgi:hypothetical protein
MSGNYVAVQSTEDYGIDGIGINANGDKTVCQVKFKTNPTAQITYADIAKTYTSGKKRHNLPLDKDNTIFVFTTGKDGTSSLMEVFGKQIRIINRKIIANKIDNNKNFWQETENLILNTIT